MQTQKTTKNGLNLGKNPTIKPYNMDVLDDDSAEINMYGDVVSIVPTDWQTGERLAGYIGVDEFIEDMEDIKDKSNITIHINSGGGDLYAGLAIYNRLKMLKGHVTTINDGLAASAASLIFQAGDTRKMNAGSNLMAHGASGFLFGFYNVDDLKTLVNEFKAHNKAVVNVYAEAMGVSYDEAKSLIDGETWLTGQEAIDKGLADELIEETEEEDPSNGILDKLFAKIQAVYGTPAINNRAIPAAAPPVANKNIQNTTTGGKETMEIKNIAELKAAFPDLVAEVESAAVDNAKKQGATEERARIQAIEEIENSILDKDLVNEAKYGENPMTAEQLAFKAMQKQAAKGNQMLNDMKNDAAKSGAEGVTATPNSGEANPGEDEEHEAENRVKNLVSLFNQRKEGKK